MLSEEQIAGLETILGPTAMGAGFFLLQLPPNGWPNMPPFLLHLGLSAGFVLIVSGFALLLVGLSRLAGKFSWQITLVQRWDIMKNTNGFYTKAPILIIILLLVISAAWSALAQEQHGPITVDDASKCPKSGYIIMESNKAINGDVGYSFPADANICLVKNLADHNGVGYQIRPTGH